MTAETYPQTSRQNNKTQINKKLELDLPELPDSAVVQLNRRF